MDSIGVEGRTLKAAIDKACEELSVGQNDLRYKLDVAHFRDSMGKARGVDTVKIIAWAEVSDHQEAEAVEAEPVAETAEVAQAPKPRKTAKEVSSKRPSSPKKKTEEKPVVASSHEPADEGSGADDVDAKAIVEAFVGGALMRTGLSAAVSVKDGDDRIQVDLGDLNIGDVDQSRVSKALRSIEYLANRLSTPERDRLPRVSMSSQGGDDDGRSEKEAHLKAVAGKVVAQVLKDDRPLTLKPMNSYERRIIHLAVSDYDGVGSRSIGDGQRKRVQVYPQEGAN